MTTEDTPATSDATYPLSYGQLSLWITQNAHPQSCAYNFPVTFRLLCALDEERLARAAFALLQRHPLLRVRFQVHGGTPVQTVGEIHPEAFALLDASTLTDGELHRRVLETHRHPFDLVTGPVCRIRVFRRSPSDYVVLLSAHHIVFDARSTEVVLRELLGLYLGEPTPAARTFFDYLQAETDYLASDRYRKDVEFWEATLAGELPVAELPLDSPRPPTRRLLAASQPFDVPDTLSRALLDLAREQRVSPSMLLAAAFQAVLSRYTVEDDILLGITTTGRAGAAFADTVGYFPNTLVIRNAVTANSPFSTFLKDFRSTWMRALRHQDLPFALLVKHLQPRRHPGFNPLVQVAFTLHTFALYDQRTECLYVDMDGRVTEWGPLRITSYPIPHEEGVFDLFLELRLIRDQFLGAFKYNAAIFVPETIGRLTDHLLRALNAIVRHPDQEVREIPILGPIERHRIVGEFNGTEGDAEDGGTIHALFERQAQQTPDATAVVHGDERLTYGELNARANQVAWHLRSLGVGNAPDEDTLVGVCVHRSIRMLVYVLGILKAGAAYVPLDPAYPAERLAFIVEDTRVRLVLGEEGLAGLERRPTHDPPALASGRSLAYVIYTSGSTGRPKGVMIEHRNAVHLLRWARPLFTPDELRGVLASSSVCFDLSVFELFFPLSCGGTVILVESIMALADPDPPPDITLLNTVPSALSELLNVGVIPPSVSTIMMAGEVVTQELVHRLYTLPHIARVYDLYGPAEDTTYSTWSLRESGSVPTIGRPISGTQIYIVDQALQPVPMGVPGEICIAGRGLARGYLRREALTAEKFVQNPFGEGRLYRTGDLGRFRPDGTIAFIGRRDTQVKVRGYRIELGEIEATLEAHHTVNRAAVLVTDRHLVAYLELAAGAGAELDAATLKDHLRSKLPRYMVPERYVRVERWPRTPSGKLDRKALGRLATPASTGSRGGSPRNAREDTLRRIWAHALGREASSLGIHDAFFEVGGDSINAVQVVVALRTQLGVEIDLNHILRFQTIEELAAALDQAPRTNVPIGGARLGARAPATRARPAWLRLESQPLDLAGDASPIDAVAVAYLPAQVGGTAVQSPARDPVVGGLDELSIGRIATILLPLHESDLYGDRRALHAGLEESLRIARRLGAGVVSLTGLLPSVTCYGTALRPMRDAGTFPRVTTGHATTAAAVVMTLEHLLEKCERPIERESLGCLGLGSIGTSALRLFLATNPHPETIHLCDVFRKREELERLGAELVDRFGYRGNLTIALSGHEIPDEFYRSSLIVGATNVGGILAIERVGAGALIVDDSSPHCFDPRAAFGRLAERGDILFAEGGLLQTGEPIRKVRYLPETLADSLDELDLEFYQSHTARQINGCMLSGLLSARCDVPVTVGGAPAHEACVEHHQLLRAQSIGAAPVQLGGAIIGEEVIAAFRELRR